MTTMKRDKGEGFSRERIQITRYVHRSLPRAIPTILHYMPHGGMGDRVVFQGVVKHALDRRNTDHRIIAVITNQFDEYCCRDYIPRPDEIWVLLNSDIESLEDEILELEAICEKLHPSTRDIETYIYAGFEAYEEKKRGTRYHEYYTYYTNVIYPEGYYPEFPLLPSSVLAIREQLNEAGIEVGARPLVAVHCRQGQIGSKSNPYLPDFIELVRHIKQDLDADLVLFSAGDEDPAELTSLCAFLCPYDETLQLPAGLLSLCDLMVGGDSGPAHLAAAVSTPVVSIRGPMDPSVGWINGPFCPPQRLAAVNGEHLELSDRKAITFDVEQGRRSAARLPGEPPRARNHPLLVEDSTPDGNAEVLLSWEDLIFIADFLEASGVSKLSLQGKEPFAHPHAVDFIHYLLERHLRVAVYTSGGLSSEQLARLEDLLNLPLADDLSLTCSISNGPLKDRVDWKAERFLNTTGRRTSLYLHIVQPEIDLDYPLQLVSKYGLRRRIILGVEAEMSQGRGRQAVPEEMPRLSFSDRTNLYRLRMDRIHLQIAGSAVANLFSDEDLGRLYKASARGLGLATHPRLTIGPEMMVCPGYPSAQQSKRSLYDFDLLSDVRAHYGEPPRGEFVGLAPSYRDASFLLIVGIMEDCP